jgi:hypothetical protein
MEIQPFLKGTIFFCEIGKMLTPGEKNYKKIAAYITRFKYGLL